MIDARVEVEWPAPTGRNWWQRVRCYWTSPPTPKPIKRESRSGKVFLIGAGPGDPELLTLKAARLLAQADVVLYDRLIAPAILALIPAQAKRQYVGKSSGDHHVAQAETERLLVHYARQGLQVVRLKGGDPFLFGRGGEEMQTLWRAGIDVEVVPGITAALGCGASAGIPLTHRDYASSVLFLTGCNQHGELPADNVALARRDQTLVIYMGLARLPQLSQALRKLGLPAEWPVALIEHGTTPAQRVVTGTLANIAEQSEAAALQSPTMVIVGRVVEVLKSHCMPAPVDAGAMKVTAALAV